MPSIQCTSAHIHTHTHSRPLPRLHSHRAAHKTNAAAIYAPHHHHHHRFYKTENLVLLWFFFGGENGGISSACALHSTATHTHTQHTIYQVEPKKKTIKILSVSYVRACAHAVRSVYQFTFFFYVCSFSSSLPARFFIIFYSVRFFFGFIDELPICYLTNKKKNIYTQNLCWVLAWCGAATASQAPPMIIVA